MVNKKIEIAFVIDSLQIGGANILTMQVIKYLSREKFKIRLIVLSSKATNARKLLELLSPDVEIVNIDLYSLSFFNRFIVLKNAVKNCDLMHTCMENSNLYGGLANLLFMRKKIVSTIHGVDGIFIDDKELMIAFKKNVSKKYIFLIKYVQNYIFKFYSKVISVSDKTKSFLIEKRHLKENKVKVIYHGIDIPYSENELCCNNQIRDKLYLKRDEFVIAYAGRITYAKGLEMLVDVFNELKNEFINTKLLLIGDGEIKELLEEKIRSYNLESRCIITGFVNNINDYYEIIDMFVLPSKSEGVPLTLLEAMYYGKISLCSNVGGIPEIIKNGINGFLFEKENSEELKQKIKYIITNFNDTQKISMKAKKTIWDKFNLSKNIKNIETEFLNILEK